MTNTCYRNVLDSGYNCRNDLMQVQHASAVSAYLSVSVSACLVSLCLLSLHICLSLSLSASASRCSLCLSASVTSCWQVLTTTGHPWASSGVASFFLKLTVYLFPIVAIVSSIPVFSIVIKYNLVENGVSDRVAFLWGVVFPWVLHIQLATPPNLLLLQAISMPLLYMPNILAQFVNFTSLIFVSFTDFIVPFTLYIVLQKRYRHRIRSRVTDCWRLAYIHMSLTVANLQIRRERF